MRRQVFIDYLLSNGCVLVREDKKGYSIYRNVITLDVSGVPNSPNGVLRASTICRVCKTLGINPPEEAKIAEEIINIAHNNHGNNR